MLQQLFSSPCSSFLGKVLRSHLDVFTPMLVVPVPGTLGGLQKVTLNLIVVRFGLPQNQEVLHGHYFLIQWISTAHAEQTRARAEDSSLTNECLCHEAVSPITVLLSHSGSQAQHPVGAQQAMAISRGRCWPWLGDFMILKSSASVVIHLGPLAQEVVKKNISS